jgi:hypothetical protein
VVPLPDINTHILTFQRPAPPVLTRVEWVVLSADKPDEIKNFLDKNQAAIILTPAGYEALARNTAALKAYIESLQALVETQDDYMRQKQNDSSF